MSVAYFPKFAARLSVFVFLFAFFNFISITVPKLWACELPQGLKAISQCVDASGNVTVGPGGTAGCERVYFDKDFTGASGLKTVTIQAGGEAYVDDLPLQVEVETMEVMGLLQVGFQACPVGTADPKNQVTFTFLGARPCPSPETCSEFSKGIQVHQGGVLRMFGAKGVPASSVQGAEETGISWTHLSAPAGPEAKYGTESGALAPVVPGGSSTLQLADDVTQGPGPWQVGDWIAVATTGFSPVETEIVQIASLNQNATGGTTVTVEQLLQFYHFGSPDPGEPSLTTYNDCSGFNYGVDERAEVGLLSRNIKLTARIEAGANNLHWGGELRFHKGFGEVALQGVEIEKFGKDQLASYPIHFHQTGDLTTPPLVNANSVHHSYNKCVTIHSTSNVTVENMVCTRVVGHMFYEEIGDETGIRFLHNLGLGAMANGFDVPAASPEERDQNIKDHWWAGDHLGQKDSPDYNGYDGFNIPNTDAQNNPVRGVCATPEPNGGPLIIGQNPYTPEHMTNKGTEACAADEVYFEPNSGFWIINPATDLIGNSIGGCQDVGRGYWYVPPKNRPDAGVPADLTLLSHRPIGTFQNNRVHGCYSGLYAEPEFGVFSDQLIPREGGQITGKNVIARFDGLISTRNRDRGVWLRPVWYVLQDGRFATNRNSVTLVSSGGLDGNAPGVWALLEDSVLVGVSQNNVDRWGPCPRNAPDLYDCVNPNRPANSAPNGAKGFPSPYFNLSGYMIYDGPVRIFRNRFVNFNRDITPHLTVADREFLEKYTAYPNPKISPVYEGDAALGWFQNNQSAYPTGTESRELSFENTDLRHQIYTEQVNLGDFQDGDKNTAILDLDGTLTGFHVVDAEGKAVPGAHPISLNNLEFNHASNSVDECLAEGEQDAEAEGRPTSLISAGHYATLEFQTPYPPPLPTSAANTKQLMTFMRDQTIFGEHPEMSLTSRNGLGVWEPKVASGYGFTVGASTCSKGSCSAETGIASQVSVGLTDAVKPGTSMEDPFYVRVGICYTNKDGTHPSNDFTITRGYRSWGGNGANTADTDLQQYFNVLINRYQNQQCHNLDVQNLANLDVANGCPANGITAVPQGGCPAPAMAGTDQQGQPACIYPKETLQAAGSIEELTLGDGSPDLTKYFYDAGRGLLFFYVAQELPNAFGPSPLGTCSGAEGEDPSCPDLADGESYYACPAAGCSDYQVLLNDANYDPGASNCEAYPEYVQDPPPDQLLLAHSDTGQIVQQVEAGGLNNMFPHFEAQTPPHCPESTAFEETVAGGATLNLSAKLQATDQPGPPRCPSNPSFGGGGCTLTDRAASGAWTYFMVLANLVVVWTFRRRKIKFYER